MNANIKYQPLIYKVLSSGEEVTIDADADKLYKRITGIHASVGDADAVLTSTIALNINGKEIFPSGFEIKMITTGQEVSPNERYFDLEEPAAGTKIKGIYKDGATASAYPYQFIIYLKLEDK